MQVPIETAGFSCDDIYGMGQEVLFWKIEKISINCWFLRPYTYNLVKMQILGNFKWILLKKATILENTWLRMLSIF